MNLYKDYLRVKPCFYANIETAVRAYEIPESANIDKYFEFLRTFKYLEQLGEVNFDTLLDHYNGGQQDGH